MGFLYGDSNGDSNGDSKATNEVNRLGLIVIPWLGSISNHIHTHLIEFMDGDAIAELNDGKMQFGKPMYSIEFKRRNPWLPVDVPFNRSIDNMINYI